MRRTIPAILAVAALAAVPAAPASASKTWDGGHACQKGIKDTGTSLKSFQWFECAVEGTSPKSGGNKNTKLRW